MSDGDLTGLNTERAVAYEEQLKRGRLKIFLGYAPGVGKTYAMLKAAHQRLEEGVDVVAGLVEPHGRPEIEELLEPMEIVPSRQFNLQGEHFSEMDLDGVLARRPALVLVDELAHANAAECRHSKRYHDVLELLDAGIDVYTTLNIQHLESVNDVVAHITGIVVRETVPDRILDEADEIELIDLPIDELLQRLAEKRVHVPPQEVAEARQFYRAGNLNALRELAFRRAADRVDEQMRAYMQSHGISGPWAVTERLMVCVGPSPLSERLVRAGRRLAARLNAEWFAVYVETPAHATLSENERDRLAQALRLAEELGARSVMLPGRSVAEAVGWFAQTRNVTKIIVGKPLQPRWRELLRGSVVDQIVRHSENTDVYVISGKAAPEQPTSTVTVASRSQRWPGFLISAGLVGLVTLGGLPLRSVIEPTNLVMLYLLAVIIAALRLGRWPAIVASTLSVLAFDLFFVPPYYDFVVSDAQYLLTFAGLLIVGLMVSTLTAQAQQRVRAEQRRETHTIVLYQLSRDLAGAADLQRVAEVVVRHVEETLGGRAVVLSKDGERLEATSASAGFLLDSDERAAAQWALEHDAAAGRFTDTLASASALYLPLKTARDVVGVLGVALAEKREKSELPTPEQRRLLESFASQAAVAIERSKLAEDARQAQLLQETEKLQTALLNSISHDLRTPLASITGVLSSLQEDTGLLLDDEARAELVHTAYDEAERLNRLVGNLLKMTQLESGALQVTTEPHDIEDVVGVALAQLSHRLGRREVEIDVPEALPLAQMDFVLMILVMVNLLENAHKYSPPGTRLRIQAGVEGDMLRVEVLDRGRGMPADQLERVFDKFYRLRGADDVGGTGLGLSISRGIVEAQGGRVWAEKREGGGSVFIVTLPLAEELDEKRRLEAVR